MEAGVEVELESVAHIGSRDARREDESAFADVDLDYFCDCAACQYARALRAMDECIMMDFSLFCGEALRCGRLEG